MTESTKNIADLIQKNELVFPVLEKDWAQTPKTQDLFDITEVITRRGQYRNAR
jgi:hypothetical protein